MKYEKTYPFIGALITAIIVYFTLSLLYKVPSSLLKDVLAATIGLSAIYTGIMAMALSIIYALADRPIIQALKRVQRPPGSNISAYNVIISYMLSSIRWSLILSVYSLAIIPFSTEKDSLMLHIVLASVLTFLLMYTTLTILRVINIIAEMLME